MDPHRHNGMAYRPTGPTLLSGQDITDAVGEALGRKVRHIDVPPKTFAKAVRASANAVGTDEFLQSSLHHYSHEHALKTWEMGGPTTHVRDVAGGEPEDILTIARRYANGPERRRTVRNFLRAIANSLRGALTPMPDGIAATASSAGTSTGSNRPSSIPGRRIPNSPANRTSGGRIIISVSSTRRPSRDYTVSRSGRT
jgi:hypothetical protein